MSKETLNLHPLQELLNSEIDLEELIEHLDVVSYNFTECTLKVSCAEDEPIYPEVVLGYYWLERVKRMFKEMRKNRSGNFAVPDTTCATAEQSEGLNVTNPQ
ncbi:MAG: hypothetical protein LBR52_03955 [Prevotellaceae bacterium]|jgi:hypothetical protein|nr:hypothetical protein [Prevotellaceae bacterium]